MRRRNPGTGNLDWTGMPCRSIEDIWTSAGGSVTDILKGKSSFSQSDSNNYPVIRKKKDI